MELKATKLRSLSEIKKWETFRFSILINFLVIIRVNIWLYDETFTIKTIYNYVDEIVIYYQRSARQATQLSKNIYGRTMIKVLYLSPEKK